jgi:hypothetical protein
MSERSISCRTVDMAIAPAWVGSLVLSRTVIKPLIVLSALPCLDRNSKTASNEDLKIRSKNKNKAPTLVIPANIQKSAQTDFNAT